MSARLQLRRADGVVYLDRWGIEWKHLGGIFLHRMDGPDPGREFHDHPWWFASFVVKGGYEEYRAPIREPDFFTQETRRRWSVRSIRLDECHRIFGLHGRTWTLVIHGPVRRKWGFYTPEWVPWHVYEQTERGRARGLEVPVSSGDAPYSRPGLS